MGSLGHVVSWMLDTFHGNHLQPSEEFLSKARGDIDRICEFLKRYCFEDEPWRHTKVLKVVKGGSLGKGTAMKTPTADLVKRQLSDADLVLFLNVFHSYTDQKKDRKRIIDEIERRLEECKENMYLELEFEKSKWPNPRVLQFKLRSRTSVDFIDFDILPAYDALGQYNGSRPDPQIYVGLIECGGKGEFSPCFTELQRDFIKPRPTKLKNLIRLVKHWYKEVQEKSFPAKYALELLTVYAWEQGSGQYQFNMAEGFRTVLWLIEKHKELRIYWTKYYGIENETIKQYLQAQLGKNRPVILDPADPTNNLGEAKGWDRMAEKAKSYAEMICCRKPNGSPVEPWNVPVAMQVPWGEGRCILL
ncbi:2'-5'-oligoadenylate synthase 1A-like [Erythrolamprus reginae]|uniref:2'-5'-oligoadenylate synthase 1A-like n=1 Tax=Erythrolamprus reginae TaxID=121349 RepID=UPI00396C848B